MTLLFTIEQVSFACNWYNYAKQTFLMSKNLNEIELSKIGENVKKFSKEKGLSKSELVRRTGLDYHTISKIERGITPDPRVHTVEKIAEALGVNINKLLK